MSRTKLLRFALAASLWLAWLLAPISAWAAIGTPTSVGTTQNNSFSGSTITLSSFTTANITAGNLVVVAISSYTGAGNTNITVSSVSDGTNTYTSAVSTTGSRNFAYIFYKQNASAVSSGATLTIGLSTTASSGSYSVDMIQVSGILSSGALDSGVNATGSGSGTSISITSGTFATSNEIAIGAIGIGGTTASSLSSSWSTGPSAPFTNITNDKTTGPGHAIDYDIVAATTAVTYTGTLSGSAGTNGLVTAFKGAASTVVCKLNLLGVGC